MIEDTQDSGMLKEMLKPSSAAGARPLAGTLAPCYLFHSHEELARQAAERIALVIRERNASGQNAVLSLPTGSTAVSIYRELVRMHEEEKLDFSRVETFNLFEFHGVTPDHLHSQRRWMTEKFFSQVNIPAEKIHFLDGMAPMEEAEEHCRQYEAEIQRAGGIDLMLLGVGCTGQIAVNEPFSDPNGRTRLTTIDPPTQQDLSSGSFDKENVPTLALTMGMATIRAARKVLLVALGEQKASIVRAICEQPATNGVPASAVQRHPDAAVLLDEAAASELTVRATPWKLGPVEWTDEMVKRAALWLCQRTGKSLLKLDDEDFRQHYLHQLLRRQGPAQEIAHRVFRWMMATIEYHPSGREKKRIICFSPHPDDDVISMGGTLIRLVEDKHEVHVAYMTSGNIAVFDHDAWRIADQMAEFNRLFEIDDAKSKTIEAKVFQSLREKKPGDPDCEEVRQIKGLIRWSEAKAAAEVCGCVEENLHFLDLPFYRTGTVVKNPVGAEDVRLIRELIERVDPQDIYMAGDLSDPHGTHRVCAEATFMALRQLKESGKRIPEVLLYRGAWQEWAPYQIDIATPLSPRDLQLKRQAIFRHESQKDAAMFAGSDQREFWQRAEQRNQGTAKEYNDFGLPEYYALEGFVRWNGVPI